MGNNYYGIFLIVEPPAQRLVESLAESGDSEVLLSHPRRRPTSTPERSGFSTTNPTPPTLSPVPNATGQTTHFHSSGSSGDATMEAPEISPAPTEILRGTFTIGPAPSSVDSLSTFEYVDLTR